MYEFTVVGYAFLWHQIRCMVSVLFLVGEHKESPDVVSKMLDISQVKRKPQYNPASEKGLCLYECSFEDLRWEQESCN